MRQRAAASPSRAALPHEDARCVKRAEEVRHARKTEGGEGRLSPFDNER